MKTTENLKQEYISKIDRIPTVSFNKEQKEIAKKILINTEEKDLDSVYGLITQRVKTGFVFDEAPEVNHNCVALVKENEKMGINVGSVGCVEHKLIIGENYDALKNICATYIDKNGKGLIDVIYIDPPYNTDKSKADGNDYKEEVESTKFIYRDKFTRDGWLNMMNERLKLAKRLLKDSGVIFISIDDKEQAYLKVLCDEIFGEENFLGNIVWECRNPNTSIISIDHEYCVVYAKNKENIRPCYIKKLSPPYNWYGRAIERKYDELGNRYLPKGTVTPRKAHYTYYIVPASQNPEEACNGAQVIETDYQTIDALDKTKFVGHRYYAEAPETARRRLAHGEYKFFKNPKGIWSIKEIIHKDQDTTSAGLVSVIHRTEIKYDDSNKELKDLGLNEVFDYAKPVEYIKQYLTALYKKNIIVLDFFAGSGTTGQAVMELNEEDGGNRKFILVTNNENKIGEKITYERLFRVINGKGSQNEKIDWQYSKEKPSLINNSVRVFDITRIPLTLQDLNKAEKIKEEAKIEFKKLNEAYIPASDLDVYNDLAALNPQKDAE